MTDELSRGTSALASVSLARSDARSRTASSEWMPYLPPSRSPFAPAGIDAARLTWAETVAPGGYAHLRAARGTRIRLDDPTGDACAHVVLFNAVEPGERLNVADTVKIPWQAYLRTGHPLLSGDGRVLATLAEDSSGHHDAFCGTTTPAWNRAKYGDARPEGPAPAGSDLLALAGAKHGLEQRDIPPALTFFQGVRVNSDGGLSWLGSAGTATHIELIAELPLIVLIANVPHPRDPRADYIVGPLHVHAWRDAATSPADDRFTETPELERAYRNSISYAELAGL
ncbi:MAG: urea amidolyase associated protein UAAP1 [Microbacterium sp.]